MYRAKMGGRARAVVFEPWMSERVLERSRLYSDLENAILQGNLVLDLQPVVGLRDGAWHKFEALVRWQDGEVRRSPGEFLAIAEETGLIVELGTWVLRERLRQLATWPDPTVGIAVNVSPRQLEDGSLIETVHSALRETGIAPDRLTLEITEQTAVADLNASASQLSRLRDEGMHIAIDDEDEILVLSMIRLAADLNLKVVAEGVETHDQADFLIKQECTLGQGYYFSRPHDIETLRVMDAERRRTWETVTEQDRSQA